ncbi:MAG: type II/IV secretion system protein [Holosporales bacterium]|jgi:type II secretory ATPase GspE/PulE/Tfp pilus assembly ATPase PilB-like protein|nr:type II/IV secretion system protein [Holosporales bacterium]
MRTEAKYKTEISASCDEKERSRELLIAWGALESSQVNVVLRQQARTGLLFAEAALSLNLIDETTFLAAQGYLYDMETINLDHVLFDASCMTVLPRSLMQECIALIIDVRTDPSLCFVKIAIADPGDIYTRDRIIHALGPHFHVEFVVALKQQILNFYASYKRKTGPGFQTEVNRQTYDLLQEAIACRASDVHFEPEDSLVRLRLRVDGVLSTLRILHPEEWPRIRGYLKVLANLNITEHRKPQSGHARIRANNRWVDLRLSTHPSLFGEAVVIRILDATSGLIPLTELGFSQDVLNTLHQVLATPQGLFLVVGPTGSGKTTTLYALLHALNPHERNIMTLEDPIEYQMPGVRQLDLREEDVLSFSDGIRSALRQDPDVLLVGEIRDEQTAFMALRAALTGRLVLATLHAQDTFSAFDRLQDLGIARKEILLHLVGIMSQRLVRKNPCYRKKPASILGRQAIAEVLFFSQEMRAAFLATDDRTLWLKKAQQQGFLPFSLLTQKVVAEGMTTQDEIQRVFGAPQETSHASLHV